mmetsp:Transcript_125193/g.243614  ORF Transcript_125193/g.243614 Transcript_125193/m.243614 type:complete len:201 (-) Transcript_125193:1176-1778(-)
MPLDVLFSDGDNIASHLSPSAAMALSATSPCSRASTRRSKSSSRKRTVLLGDPGLFSRASMWLVSVCNCCSTATICCLSTANLRVSSSTATCTSRLTLASAPPPRISSRRPLCLSSRASSLIVAASATIAVVSVICLHIAVSAARRSVRTAASRSFSCRSRIATSASSWLAGDPLAHSRWSCRLQTSSAMRSTSAAVTQP